MRRRCWRRSPGGERSAAAGTGHAVVSTPPALVVVLLAPTPAVVVVIIIVVVIVIVVVVQLDGDAVDDDRVAVVGRRGRGRRDDGRAGRGLGRRPGRWGRLAAPGFGRGVVAGVGAGRRGRR